MTSGRGKSSAGWAPVKSPKPENEQRLQKHQVANTVLSNSPLNISNFHTILEEDINSRGSLTCDPLSWLYETEPAVDLPLQFNFGSPYRYLFSVTMYGQRTFCQLTFNSVFVQDNSPQLLLGCVL